MRTAREARFVVLWFFVLVSDAFCWRHPTKWGEKAPPGCKACPSKEQGLFDTPICGMNGIAYKNYCYLNLRNCIAKKLKKSLTLPSKEPSSCGLQMKMYNSFGGMGPFGKKKREIFNILDEFRESDDKKELVFSR